MTEVPATPPRSPLLPDPWERSGAIVLDGPLEHAAHRGWRASFWRVFQALLVLAFAFVFFQVVSYGVALLLVLLSGVPQAALLHEMTANIGAHIRSVMIGNTVGQALGLALPAVLLARLHSSRRAAFLRWRRSDGLLLLLSVLGLVALGPVVMWLGSVNSTLPLPEWVKVMEEMQLQFLEQVLGAQVGIGFHLVVLALTPAFCEELLFRGYVLRQAERGLGAAGGIVLSGVLFGLYHFRFSQALPLIALGLYLGYLVWRTGSLWPAIVVHFANNAFAVVVEAYVSTQAEPDGAQLEQTDIAWYLVVAGAICFALILAAMHQAAKSLLGQRSGGAPARSSGD